MLSMRRGPKPRRTARRVAALCFVVSASGAAQDKDAAKLFFEAGAAAAQRQDYAECAKAFAEAHRRNPHSAAIYAAAQCWESDGSLLQAARAYEEALDLGQLDLKQKEQATSRLAALLPKLSFLKLTGPPGTVVSVGAVKDAPTPAEIIVQPGLVSIFARGPGGKRQSLQVQAKAGQVQKLSVAFGEVLAPTNLTPAPQPPAQGVGKTLGWIGVSVGAAAAITAGGFYLAAPSSPAGSR